MITIHNGDTYFTLQYNGDILDSATGLDTWLLQPKPDYPHFCYFHSGQSVSLVDGVTLTGETSGAVIRVGRVVLTGGTLAGGTGIGILMFYPVSGNIVSGENLRVSTTTYCVAASAALDCPVGKPPKQLCLSVETNSIRFTCGSVAPTTSSGTPSSFGVLVQDGQTANISGLRDIKNFKMIHASSASNAVVHVEVLY